MILVNDNWVEVRDLQDVSRIIRENYNYDLADKMDSLIEENYYTESEYWDLETELNDKENEIASMEDELSYKDEQIEDLEDEIESLKEKIEFLENELEGYI